MTAALEFTPADGWTTDALDALPEDGRRRELIDGVLHMPPSPTFYHQSMSGRMYSRLDSACPDDMAVTQAVEVRISSRRSFIPDVLVVTAAAAARRPAHFTPHEVLLAVEIVSPGSVTMDRITKPALYAGAGIPFYWRVETEGGIVVTTHQLDPVHEIYYVTGEHRESITVDQPWSIDIPIVSIDPDHRG